MRPRTTLITLLIVLLLGGYIFFYERKQLTEEEREKKAKQIFSLSQEEINKIQIVREEESIICERENKEHWMMLSPLKVKADKDEIERILSALTSLKSERRIKEKGEFGLESPRLKIKIWAENKPLGFYLGENTPVGDNIYTQIAGEEDVFLVKKALFNKLNKKVKDLRDKTVIEIGKEKVEGLKLKYPQKTIECVKEREKWQISQPIFRPGDKEEIEGLLNKLRFLKVKEFVSEDTTNLKEYGLEKPLIIVEVKEENKTKVLFLGRKGDKVYAKRKYLNSIYLVREEVIEDLTKEVIELQDKQIFDFAKGEVEKLTLQCKEEIISCEKEEEDTWKILKPENKKANNPVINSILWDFDHLRANKLVTETAKTLKEYGLDKPEIKVTFEIKRGETATKETLLLGEKTENNTFYAKLWENNLIFELDAVIVENLKKDLIEKE